jgi:hypothetical protein
MKLNIKDNKGIELNFGDKVSILHIFDDSGRAVDLYGVEPQLDAWIEDVYLDVVEGELIFDHELMMVMIKTRNRKFPFSPLLRYEFVLQQFERLDLKEQSLILKEENVIDCELSPEFINDYLIKLK